MSQEQLAHTTRISSDFISALEDGRMNDLPGLVFGRGFVRCICKLFSADVDRYIKAFELASKSTGLVSAELRMPEQDAVAEYGPTEGKGSISGHLKNWVSSVNQSGWRQRMPVPMSAVVLGIGLMIAIPAAIQLLAGDQPEDLKTGKVQTQAAEGAVDEEPIALAARENAVLRSVETSGLTEKIESSQGEVAEVTPSEIKEVTKVAPAPQAIKSKAKEVATPAESAAIDGKQSLNVTVLESVKVRIKQDRTAWATKLLQPGTYHYDFAEEAQLLIFDAAAIEIEFNGKSLGSLGPKGRIRRLSFAASADEAMRKGL